MVFKDTRKNATEIIYYSIKIFFTKAYEKINFINFGSLRRKMFFIDCLFQTQRNFIFMSCQL